MNLKQDLVLLAQKDPDERRAALRALLDERGFSYVVQEEAPGPNVPRGLVNYIVNPNIEEPHLLFCAHHDAVLGSFGANDNAASICILLKLAETLAEKKIPAEFAFFDAEENRCAGSKLYVSKMKRERITGVINLDICGFGDTIAVAARGGNKAPLRNLCSPQFLKRHNGHLLKRLPKSDDASFSGTHLPTASVAIVPRWDIQFLKTLAAYGDGFLGRPPEYELILGQMEVTTTMHGGYRDTPEWVEEEAMERVYNYVLEAVTTPPKARSLKDFFTIEF